MILIGVAVVAIVGCSNAPRLTERHVDQLLEVQSSVAEERVALNKARDELVADQRKWADRKRSDPIIAESIEAAALLTACCLPPLVVFLLFRHRPQQPVFDVAETALLELQSVNATPLIEADGKPVAKLEDRREG